MDLLCNEEIIWSPCLPHIDDDESDFDQSSSSTISSPPFSSSSSGIDCFSSSNFSIDSCTIIHCSDHYFCRKDSCIQCAASTCCTPIDTRSPSDALLEAAVQSLPCIIDEQELELMLEKQFEYMPEKHYYDELQAKNLGGARCRALQGLIGAQSKFSFSHSSIALAINYFDRYLSKNVSKVWSDWMLDLLSISCLSIAAKMDEVVVPPLLDLQGGGREDCAEGSSSSFVKLGTIEKLELDDLREVIIGASCDARGITSYLQGGGHGCECGGGGINASRASSRQLP
ncbi:hypothetical protein L7F22_043047 [Adiantum nelumboides]|nr:hypothetical protein [Adiantum nelumboides]